MAHSVHNDVRVHRLARGLSQKGLAEALEVSRQTVNSIETGRYIPSLPLALALARYFDTTVEDLFHPDGVGCLALPWRLPVLQAPLGSAATPELAAAVCNAGGLGTLAGSWADHDTLRAARPRRAPGDRPPVRRQPRGGLRAARPPGPAARGARAGGDVLLGRPARPAAAGTGRRRVDDGAGRLDRGGARGGRRRRPRGHRAGRRGRRARPRAHRPARAAAGGARRGRRAAGRGGRHRRRGRRPRGPRGRAPTR